MNQIVLGTEYGVLTTEMAAIFKGEPGEPGSGGGGGSGTAFLPIPDDLDESSATEFFFGWEDVDGGWLIARQTRATAQTVHADQANNPLYTTLTAAWPDRQSLTYG
ncbi:MAG: hypothetical protein F6K48_20715 [Okeania sp. SIO3H1]|nr:hypothetical protein [Okeania sp. SIO3H1]